MKTEERIESEKKTLEDNRDVLAARLGKGFFILIPKQMQCDPLHPQSDNCGCMIPKSTALILYRDLNRALAIDEWTKKPNEGVLRGCGYPDFVDFS